MTNGIPIAELNKETLEHLGIELTAPLGKEGERHIALGKVLKALEKLEEEDRLWTLSEARRYMNGQGIVEESGKQYVPPITWTLKVVARHFELGQFDLLGRKKNTKVVTARHTAMYLLWNLQSYTLREIGEALGRRTPATVSHGYKVIADRLPADESLQERINSIKEELLI